MEEEAGKNPLFDSDEDYSLWWLILQARRTMHRVREKELFKYGITTAEIAVLFAINAMGRSATPMIISQMLLRQSHSITGLLNRMQKKGLVMRHKDLNKKNLVRIEITEKGKTAYQQSRNRECIHRIMSCLSNKERRELRSSLMKLRNEALAELGLDKPLISPFIT